MFITSRAIVLNRVRHTDQRFLTTLYTEALGSVTFAVRIPKTRKAQIRPVLFQPLSLLTIEWDHRENTDIQRLRSVSILSPYTTLTTTPAKAAIVTFLSEMLTHALRPEHDGSLFPFLQTSFLLLDQKPDRYANFHIVFLSLLARHLGFSPNMEDEPPHSNASNAVFDLLNAEFLPNPPAHSYFIEGAEARFIPTLLRLNYANMHRLRLSRAQRQRILSLLVDYYRLHIPSFPQVRSLSILTEVFSYI